jgi:hypothetical protein
MHFRLFVLTNKENAKTSEEARSYVYNELENDNSFVGEGGRFNSPIADWFVIGGRWSGALTQLFLDQDKLKEFWKEFEEKQLGWTNLTDKKEEDQQKKGKELFMQYFPNFKGEIPVWRDSSHKYIHEGSEDDAQIVTKKLWEVLNKEYETTDTHVGFIPEEPTPEEDGICDLESDEVTEENVVDKKWLVVVDYHS